MCGLVMKMDVHIFPGADPEFPVAYVWSGITLM